MALQISNISFGYSQLSNVLNGISVDVNKGETLSVVGASGCGKSTLLKLVSGILPNLKSDTYSGNILIDDKCPNEYIKEGKLAFMFQEATLMPNLTAKENIALPLKIKGIKDENKVNELIEIVGLTEYANYLPQQLSGGMKTRVSLARSFVTQPELLLLDEPFSALDIAWKSKLYVELENLRNKYNTTVVIVTHDVQEALLLANKLVVLSKDGIIKADYTIHSNFSITDRVYNISAFMTEVYADYMIPIQENIMNDKKSVI
jgi:NitT/TauT family transport system ATP-binding protein